MSLSKYIKKYTKNLCVHVYMLFAKLSSKVQRVIQIACQQRLLISRKSQIPDVSSMSSPISERYEWHANCSACSVLRLCRSNHAGISGDVSPGNSPSNFVTRPHRTSRAKSRRYAQSFYVCVAYKFPLPIHFPSADTRLRYFFRCTLIDQNEDNFDILILFF